MRYRYAGVIAINPNTDRAEVVKSATGAVHINEDWDTAVVVQDVNGFDMTILNTTVEGLFPDFYVEDQPVVGFKTSSGHRFYLRSSTPVPGPAGPPPVAVTAQEGSLLFEYGDGTMVLGPVVPTPESLSDAQIAELVRNGASATRAALNESGIGAPSTVDIVEFTTALDMRDPKPLVIAQASDSTGDATDEWFETAWREILAEKWPERPAQVRRWLKATDTYSDLTTWQTASTPGSQEPVTLARDTFTTDRANLNGTADEAGHTWAVTGTTPAVVAGGHLTQPAAGSSIAAISLGAHDSIDGTLTHSYRITATTANQQTQIAYTSSAVNGGNRLQMVIAGTTSATPKLQQVVAGVTTDLATWPTGFLTYSSTESTVNIAITVAGSTVTATVNGDTRTATIDPAAFGKYYTYFTMANAQGMRIDSFERTGMVTTAAVASNLGWLTAYNGAYAGGTAATNLERLNAMYPERPDVLFLNHGHNYFSTVTPAMFETAVLEFVEAFHAKYPDVPVVAVSQNPEFVGSGRIEAQVLQHAARQRHLRGMCKRHGWGYIPSFEAFAARADGGKSLVHSDGIHPLTGTQPGTGSRLQADVAKAWISSQSARP